jgi:signal transduction histidine kinase
VSRLRHPRTTVRWRLTLLYGGLFLVSGAALLAITYTLVEHANINRDPTRVIVNSFGATNLVDKRAVQISKNARSIPPPLQRLLQSPVGRKAFKLVRRDQRGADLHQLVIESAIALALMAILSTALGWVVAGRMLRPLRIMTTATQEISAASLHRRLAMPGPPDELRLLADTIDGLLQRLEGAFDAQRRFVANASHELRTPLTTVRALLEMIISDPTATVAGFRATCRHVLEESEQQEHLIDALLTLAQGQRGIDHPEPTDLAAVVGDVVRAHAPEAAARGVRLDASLIPAALSGDRRLVERLVSNLIDNALRHNVANGRVQVLVQSRADQAMLRITNTGPLVPGGQVERLLQPFQRLSPE